MAKGKFEKWLEPDGLLCLEAWARDGLTDEQIAKNIGIRRETLYSWKNSHANINNALKRGKEPVDIEVENALLKRALGYDVEERVTIGVPYTAPDGKTKLQNATVKIIQKHIPPDVTAQIYWLKNRKPQQWRNNPEADSQQPVLDMLSGVLDEVKKQSEIINKASPVHSECEQTDKP